MTDEIRPESHSIDHFDLLILKQLNKIPFTQVQSLSDDLGFYERRYGFSQWIHSSSNAAISNESDIGVQKVPGPPRSLTESVNYHKEIIIIWKNIND
jgi:hypothetical protein